MQDNSKYITLSQAANQSPGRPSSNAVWRWCRKGVKSRAGHRIKLHHVRVGGRIFTSTESLETFFNDLAQADASYFEEREHLTVNHTPTDKQRQRSINEALQTLDRAGI